MVPLQRPIDDLPRLYARLIERYGTNDRCRARLCRLIWPHGFVCRRCRFRKHHLIATRGLYECARCKTQHSPTAGLPVHGMRGNLKNWFAIAFFHANGCTREELMREAADLKLPERTLRRWLRHLNGHSDRDLSRFIQAFLSDLRAPE
ncbi:MAG: transposase [Fimbriimonas sp.]